MKLMKDEPITKNVKMDHPFSPEGYTKGNIFILLIAQLFLLLCKKVIIRQLFRTIYCDRKEYGNDKNGQDEQWENHERESVIYWEFHRVFVGVDGPSEQCTEQCWRSNPSNWKEKRRIVSIKLNNKLYFFVFSVSGLDKNIIRYFPVREIYIQLSGFHHLQHHHQPKMENPGTTRIYCSVNIFTVNL